MLYRLIRPALFTLDAERSHGLAIAAAGALRGPPAARDPALATRVAGIDFPNPVGLAAGLDKDATAFAGLLSLGFGSVEVGTITPLPQPGNPRPRLFRLVEDRAVINRFGFNSQGQAAARARLERRGAGVVGVNIGANKDAADRIADYVTGVAMMAGVADYLTLNISSPNTPGLRGLQDEGAIDNLLAAVREARELGGPPLFLKVAPDLDMAAIEAIAAAAARYRIDALIVGNTTVSRPPLGARTAGEAGGLSGEPLALLARARLADFRRATGGAIPLVAAGGIGSAEEAYARIRAGASLVQLYSALVYEGPGLPRRIARGLKRLLARDGFATVSAAVGVDVLPS